MYGDKVNEKVTNKHFSPAYEAFCSTMLSAYRYRKTK